MSRQIGAGIKPVVIQWARERARLSREIIAKRVQVKPNTVSDWELGYARPTIRQARSLARTLRIPYGYLFLESPPKEKIPIPDLRTVSGAAQDRLSPEFQDVLNDALRKQQWYREYIEEEGHVPLNFVGKFSVADDISLVADDISKTIRIDDAMRQEAMSWDDFLRIFIRNAETAGIIVLRSGIVGTNNHRKLSVQEFRGFALSDYIAPLVFINGRDSKAAQTFTLGHELAHIWINSSGISNPDPKQTPSEQNNSIERFCNQVAAEMLMPKLDFLDRWSARRDIGDNLQHLAAYYRVSTLAVLRQGYELGRLNREAFFEQYEIEIERQRNRDARGRQGGGISIAPSHPITAVNLH